MLSLRSLVVSASRRTHAVTAPPAVQLQAAAFSSADDGDADDAAVEVTGSVKFYHRKMNWGFIVPDSQFGDIGDVFVSRNSIVSTEDAEGDDFFPFLREKERVKFVVQNEEGRDRPLARNVMFTNGKVIPSVRFGYSKGIKEGATKKLGFDLVRTLEEREDMSDEELGAATRKLYEELQAKVEAAQNREKIALENAEAASSTERQEES